MIIGCVVYGIQLGWGCVVCGLVCLISSGFSSGLLLSVGGFFWPQVSIGTVTSLERSGHVGGNSLYQCYSNSVRIHFNDHKDCQ